MGQGVQKVLAAFGALAALALGGSALADAASDDNNSSSGTSNTAAQTQTQAPQGDPGRGHGGGGGPHVGANGKQEEPLTGDTAANVKAAALKKVSGGTVERVETDVDHGSPYEAHVRKSDGTQVEVLVNKDFEVTDVVEMKHP